jgi:hypothetical protein
MPTESQSKRFRSRAMMACLATAGAAGCAVESQPSVVYVADPPPETGLAPQTPTEAPIDTDQTLTATPGEGTGVFVEYAHGGHWRVWATCDTKTSGQPCSFVLGASSVDGSALSNLRAEGLFDGGTLQMDGPNAVSLSTQTTTAIDAVDFDATPGTAVEVFYTLEGLGYDPHYLYWIGGGILHNGAPTNPLRLTPSAP